MNCRNDRIMHRSVRPKQHTERFMVTEELIEVDSAYMVAYNHEDACRADQSSHPCCKGQVIIIGSVIINKLVNRLKGQQQQCMDCRNDGIMHKYLRTQNCMPRGSGQLIGNGIRKHKSSKLCGALFHTSNRYLNRWLDIKQQTWTRSRCTGNWFGSQCLTSCMLTASTLC